MLATSILLPPMTSGHWKELPSNLSSEGMRKEEERIRLKEEAEKAALEAAQSNGRRGSSKLRQAFTKSGIHASYFL